MYVRYEVVNLYYKGLCLNKEVYVRYEAVYLYYTGLCLNKEVYVRYEEVWWYGAGFFLAARSRGGGWGSTPRTTD